jgi:hypothetical protein
MVPLMRFLLPLAVQPLPPSSRCTAFVPRQWEAHTALRDSAGQVCAASLEPIQRGAVCLQ